MSEQLRALKMLQRECALIELDFHRRFYALDMEYQQLRQVVYDRRKKIINGDGSLPGSTEIENGITDSFQKLMFNDETNEKNENIEGIDEFWLQALKNCTYNDDLIRDCDEEALVFLRDVRVQLEIQPKLAFTLEFEFGPNTFFKNSILTKKYFLDCDSDERCDGFSIIETVGCKIRWRHGMNLVDNNTESFFKFFSPPEISDDSAQPVNEIDSKIFFELQQDFEIGLFIKEKLIPNAASYYMNEIDEIDDITGEFESYIGDADNTIVP